MTYTPMRPHAYDVHAHETHAYEIDALEMHVRKVLGSPTLQTVVRWSICRVPNEKKETLAFYPGQPGSLLTNPKEPR
jgi:hypothetical protein